MTTRRTANHGKMTAMGSSKKMSRLIATSSLGSPGARALRSRTPKSAKTEIAMRANKLSSSLRGMTKKAPYKPS